MTNIKFQSRLIQTEDKAFTYSHSARTWLLLAGYLPTTEDTNVFINIYTSEIATLERV